MASFIPALFFFLFLTSFQYLFYSKAVTHLGFVGALTLKLPLYLVGQTLASYLV